MGTLTNNELIAKNEILNLNEYNATFDGTIFALSKGNRQIIINVKKFNVTYSGSIFYIEPFYKSQSVYIHFDKNDKGFMVFCGIYPCIVTNRKTFYFFGDPLANNN